MNGIITNSGTLYGEEEDSNVKGTVQQLRRAHGLDDSSVFLAQEQQRNINGSYANVRFCLASRA